MMQARRQSGLGPLAAGEQAESLKRNRKVLILGGTFAVGLVVGIMVGLREGEDLFTLRQDWPPAMALGIAVSYLAAVFGGGLALSRQTDEFERGCQYKAVAFAGFAYILVYPVWFALWMGALAPEPHHGVLFVLFWLSLVLASIFYRFR